MTGKFAKFLGIFKWCILGQAIGRCYVLYGSFKENPALFSTPYPTLAEQLQQEIFVPAIIFVVLLGVQLILRHVDSGR